MKLAFATVALAAAVAGSACGGAGGSSTPAAASPTAPSATSSAGGASVTVNIVGTSGAGAYNPNPAQAKSGDTVVFHNNDSTQHRIVMDDGSADLGTINAGGSAQMQLNGNGGAFHCTIHPSMVGSINGSIPTAMPDPGCPGGYCIGGN